MDAKEKSKLNLKEETSKGQKPSFLHCLGGLPTVLCVMMSICSMAFCFMMNFKTSHLEHRVQVLEMERLSLIHPLPTALEPNGTVLGLQKTIEKLLQEVREQQLKGPVYLYRCHSTLWHDYSERTDPRVRSIPSQHKCRLSHRMPSRVPC